MKIGWVKYNEKKSDSLGVYVSGKGTYNAAELDIASYVVPGRNGEVLISNGRYKNIEVTYPAFAPSDFEQRVQAVRNWMRSAEGYRRIEDNYDPDHFRMGIAKKVLTFSTSQLNRGANFQMVFDCKPQRFLKSGEEPVPVGEWGPTVIESGNVVSFDYPNDHGLFKSLSASIAATQNLNGYAKPWPGGAGKNKLPIAELTSYERSGVTVLRDVQGALTFGGKATQAVSIGFKEFTLPAGGYIFSGGDSFNFGTGITIYIRDLDNTSTLAAISAAGEQKPFELLVETNVRFYIVVQADREPSGTFYPMVRLSDTDADFEPWQNVCPITGQTSEAVTVTGKNLVDDSKRAKVGNTLFVGATSSTQRIFFKAGTYTVSVDSSYSCNFCVRPWGSSSSPVILNPAINRTATFTLDNDGEYRCFFASSLGIDYDDIGTVQIEVGSTATAYEPYQGQTVTVQLGQTVYGGTIDVVSGTLTLTHKMVAIDQNTSSLAVGTNATTGMYYCSSSPISAADAGINTSSGGELLCDTFNVSTGVAIGNTYLTGYGKTLVFVLPDQTIDTVEKARIWLTSNPVTWVYELATPQIVQLTGRQINTLMGQNNVWANTGDVSAEFGDNPGILENPTQFLAQPIIKVMNPATGATINVGGAVLTCSDGYSGEVVIDCEQMNIYSGETNLNSKWAGEFPTLAGGNNNVSFTGADSVEIIPNWWEL